MNTLPRMDEFSFKHKTQPDKPSMTSSELKASFDSRADELKIVINSIVDALEKVTSTSGADQIGSEAITDISGATIRDQLVDFRNKLKSVVDGSSGADFVNATGIAGIAGTTVQTILESLKLYIETLVNTHKSELSSTVVGSSGTEIIGSAPISGVSGSTAYAQLIDLKAQINAAVTGQIPDQSITPQKLSFNPAVYPYGVAVGSPNIYGVTLSPAPTSYVDGMAVTVKINVDSTTASTLNVNGLGGIPLKKSNGADATNLKANGIYTFRYNFSTGNFILQGEGGSGNATTGDILSGKSASTDAGDIVGTMPNNGAITINPWSYDQAIPAGYHSGAGKVPAVVVPVANVLAGTTIANQAGTMTNRSGAYQPASAMNGVFQPNRIYVQPPKGYYDQTSNTSYTYIEDPDFIAPNIPSDINLFGLQGTMSRGKRVVKGSVSTLYDNASQFTNKDGSIVTARRYVQITGHGFVPGTIVLTSWFSASNDNGYYFAIYRDVKFDGSAAANNYWETTDQKIGWKPNVGACVVNADMIRLPYTDPNINLQANYVIIEA